MAQNNQEIELKFKLDEKEFLEIKEKISKIAKFVKNISHKDEYISPPHRNFLKPKYPYEWLSIRERGNKAILNYKHFYPEETEVHTHCDELEFEAENAEQLRQLFSALNFKTNITVEKQREVFGKFLQLSQELDLPAVIHSRDASKDTLLVIHEENQGELKGVLHCFSGDMDLGREALELGLFISFTGNITFPKADRIRNAAKEIPLDRIMIETDCPFLAPQTYRGKRNEPAYVIKVAEQIAEAKGITIEEVARQTTKNAKNFQIFFFFTELAED